MHNHIEEVLLTAEQIQQRVRELGQEITQTYRQRGAEEVILVALLRGASVFLADLARTIDVSCTLEFMVVEKGHPEEDRGPIKIIKDLDCSITNRHVIVVEDIIDEGQTVQYVMEALRIRDPASLLIVTLFDKPARRVAPVTADLVGFTVPDHWVVGYGLDYQQRYRNLPMLAVLNPQSMNPMSNAKVQLPVG